MTEPPPAAPDPGAAQRDIGTALSLMRMALALLDRSDDSFASARLSHAIDTLKRSLQEQTRDR